MYIADAFGYLGSVTVLLIKNFANLSQSWLSLFTKIAYITAFLTIALGVAGTVYLNKEKRLNTLRKA